MKTSYPHPRSPPSPAAPSINYFKVFVGSLTPVGRFFRILVPHVEPDFTQSRSEPFTSCSFAKTSIFMQFIRSGLLIFAVAVNVISEAQSSQ